jgi:hypothetical protein
MWTNETIVKYNHKFLKSTGADAEIANMSGVIKSGREIKKGLYLYKVLWAGESEVKGVLSSNLARIKDGLLLDVE